jgi:hypothetical protein
VFEGSPSLGALLVEGLPVVSPGNAVSGGVTGSGPVSPGGVLSGELEFGEVALGGLVLGGLVLGEAALGPSGSGAVLLGVTLESLAESFSEVHASAMLATAKQVHARLAGRESTR